jgi:FkbM family methyltransferase
MQPNSFLWKTLEFYGTKVRHRGKWRVHNYLRTILRADYDGDLEVQRQGLHWRLNPSDFVQTHLYWTGEYETWDLLHLSRYARPGSVVFDIGANFGYYSIVLASLMRGAGHVFAFEPSKGTFSRLQINIAMNQFESSITATRCGLSDKPGTTHLEEVAGNSGATTFALDERGETIVLETLDNFCKVHQVERMDLIKVDVEGNELRVLEGSRESLIRWSPVLMVEFNQSALERAGTSVEKLVEFLRETGYELFVAKRDQMVPFQSASQESMIVNVFCIPKTA